MSTSYPSELTDAHRECVQRYLPPLSRRGRPRNHSLARILDAIFYVLRTGCPWRYLPSSFPFWQTVVCHFRQFRLKNTLPALYPALHKAEREQVGRTLGSYPSSSGGPTTSMSQRRLSAFHASGFC
jgi:putative transposase